MKVLTIYLFWTGRGSKRKANNKAETEEETLVIERKRCAEGVRDALLAARPDLIVVLNPQKPRKKSLEVTLVEGGKGVCLWTGIKLGPPARLKFPEPAIVVAALEEALKNE
uniref:Uncharacterized protein n=2 Tax=Oncorhynchus TaxID=8016 RepID=A0A8C8EVD1_ONCTS